MRFLAESFAADARVAVVGFGYVGTCLGVTLAECGLDVVAVEQHPAIVADLRAGRSRIAEPGLAEAITRVRSTGRLTATTDYDAVADVDVVVITVGTPVTDRGDLDAGPLIDACQQLAPRLRAGQLVVVKSTVPPGTTRTLVAPLLESGGLVHETDFGLAFCPERLAEGEALGQLRELPVIVGGCGPHSAAAATSFWRRTLGVPVHTVANAETAEMVKLATNWWIDANIALANELARYCASFKIDVLDVIGRANALPKGAGNVNILLPSLGVGGACLTKDPWMVWRDAKNRGVELATIGTARAVNDAMPAHTAGMISDELTKIGRDPAEATVAVLGVAFKNNTGDLRNTPVRPVVAALRELGVRVRLHDPLADPDDVAAVFGQPAEATLEATVAGADCVAVLAGHRLFRELDFAALRGLVATPCLVFDGRAYYPSATIERLRLLGYDYRGIGR